MVTGNKVNTIFFLFHVDLSREEAEEEYEEEEAEEETEGEEESALSEYDPEDFVSGGVASEGGTIPADLFQFEYPLHGTTNVM